MVLDRIKTFLDSMQAVSQTNYQIWDAKGRLVFFTEKQKPDFLTMSGHLKMAKKIVRSDAFSYAPVDHNRFICGIPMKMEGDAKGAILAMGQRPKLTHDNGHPVQLSAFLEQVLRLGMNGVEKNTPPTAQHSSSTPDAVFEDLFLVANISKQFRSLRFKQPVMGKLMHRMFDSMGADAVFLQLPKTPQYNILEIRPDYLGSNGNAESKKNEITRLIADGIEQCSGNYCVVNDSRQEPDFEGFSSRPYRFLAVALRHLKKTYGWLGMVSYKTGIEFRIEELNILQTLANQLAAMIANMEHHDDLERFTVNIVCSLVNAIEAKDAYTQGHSKRVHQYAMQIARGLNIPSENLDGLKWAAVLHDIGKIGIPERILRKPGTLTEKEFNMIREHPMKGKTILSPIRQLADSMDAIAHHHERYDGKGYPEGLQGKEIPLDARILAVADTFDAITSKRSYHTSKTKADALLILDQVAGTQLDPFLVEVFLTTLKSTP